MSMLHDLRLLLALLFLITGRVEVRYLHQYAGISTSMAMPANPIVNFYVVAGTNALALGTNLSFDTAFGKFTKCNAGLSFTLNRSPITYGGRLSEALDNLPKVVLTFPQSRKGSRLGNDTLVDGMMKDGLWDVYNDVGIGVY